MKKILILLSLPVLILTSNILSAQEDPIDDDRDGPPPRHEFDRHEFDRHGKGKGPHGMEGKMPLDDQRYLKDELKLTDDQIAKITKINQDFREQFAKFRELMSPERLKLMDMLLKEDVNLDEVKARLKRIGDMKIDIQMTKIKHRLEIEKVLTPEQKDKHRKEMKQRRKMGRHDR
jgi:Spy/CpxP family protein refolding chaperone